MRYVLLFLFGLSLSLNVEAQVSKSCVAHQHFQDKLAKNPSMKWVYENIQKQISANLNTLNKDLSGDTLIIPVVFQIIHNGDAIGVQENISEDLILEQIEQLNHDFSRNNADQGDTPSAFLNVAADTEIQFCLASLDQTGAPTSGIVRTHIDNLPNVDESDCWTADYIDSNIIAPLIWNRNNYLNVFTVIGIDKFENGSCTFFNTLGYAQFPGGPSNTDAVTLAFYTVGSLNMPNPILSNYMGRTLTHEVGHWLNLFHLWGPNTGGCNQDDGIVDTPDQFDASVGCNAFPFYDNCSPSGDGLMFMNYMDYSDDDCMNLFTAGQRGMMRSTIFNARNSLINALCNQEFVLSIPPQLNFNATLVNDEVHVTIALVSDTQPHSLIIEKSTDLNAFEVISVSNTFELIDNEWRFDFIDNNPSALNYYKCKVILNNNIEVSSKIELVTTAPQFDNIVILPNPANSYLDINGLDNTKLYDVFIYDIVGRLIKETSVSSEDNRIDIHFLPSGVYNLVIKSGDSVLYERIIVDF